MPVLAGILQSLWRLGSVNARVRCCEKGRSLARQRGYSTNGLAEPADTTLQCRAEAARTDFFVAVFFAPAPLRAASRPADRISSENSPFPAIRDNTNAPIMVASAADACLRAALCGTSGIWSAIKSIIWSS